MKRMRELAACCAATMLGFGSARADGPDVAALTEENMFPFVPSYALDAAAGVADMSHLLTAPAGKDGRIRVENGRFVNDRGRIRFNGTNLTGGSNFPSHEEAERLAARLARFGINCLRLHYFDAPYGSVLMSTEPGIFQEDKLTGRRFDPDRRDRLDYLIAQLKKRGIYVNMNLHVARKLDERDGYTSCQPWLGKGVDMFDPRLIEEQKVFAKELLAHVNPYTGQDYLTDPVIAMVEINNENSPLFVHMFYSALDKIGEPYATRLRILWNDWLLKKYGSSEKLREAWGSLGDMTGVCASYPDPRDARIEDGKFPMIKQLGAPAKLLPDVYRFLMEVEQAYWTEMTDYLKNDLGLRAPLSGTQLGFSTPYLQARLDYLDSHAYWQHPDCWSRPNGRETWTAGNDPMVADAAGGCITALAVRRVAGQPYTVSEYNNPYPNFYGAEGQPMLHAYGAFQGWDGTFSYSYANRQKIEPLFTEYFFSIVARTDVLAHLPACAAMFLRGDVRESRKSVVAGLPFADYLKRLCATRNRDDLSQGIDKSPAAPPATLALVHGVSVDVTGAAPAAVEPVVDKTEGKPFTSDTGELTWQTGKDGAYWTVDTANTKLFSGFPKGRAFDLGGVKIAVGETKLGWATVSLVSHGATGFGEKGRPARVLLAATGLTHNGGAKFKKDGDSIACRGVDWGTGKTVCEGVPAVVTLPAPAARTTCHALDERGEPKGEVPVTADADGRAVVTIGPEYRTVWYEIRIAR